MTSQPEVEHGTSGTTAGRREHKKRVLRERILETASDLIADDGLAMATVEQIAQRAGISQSTFFNYFPSKPALVDALVERMIELFESVIDEAHSVDAPAASKITALFEISAELTRRRHRLLRELICEAVRSPAGAPAGVGRMQALFTSDLVEGQRLGTVRMDLDAGSLADAVLGLYMSITLFWTTEPDYPIAERLRQAGDLAGELLTGDDPPGHAALSRNADR